MRASGEAILIFHIAQEIRCLSIACFSSYSLADRNEIHGIVLPPSREAQAAGGNITLVFGHHHEPWLTLLFIHVTNDRVYPSVEHALKNVRQAT